MKRIITYIFLLLPMLLNAGVIMKRSGERLEDISIKSVTDTEVIYADENGTENTLPKSEVSALLYDDGRYEEIKNQVPESNNSVQTISSTSKTKSNQEKKDSSKSKEQTKKLAGNTTSSSTADSQASIETERTDITLSEVKTNSNRTILLHYKSKAERRRFGHTKAFSYGDIEMDENEMLAFVAARCPEAFNKLIAAKQVQTGGWSIFGLTGAGCVPIYIPLLAAGYVNYDKAIEFFNNNCAE